MSDLARTCSGPWTFCKPTAKLDTPIAPRCGTTTISIPDSHANAFFTCIIGVTKHSNAYLKLARTGDYPIPYVRSKPCSGIRIYNPIALIKWLRYNKQIAKESTEITEEFLSAVHRGEASLNTLYSSFGTHSPMATSKQSA